MRRLGLTSSAAVAVTGLFGMATPFADTTERVSVNSAGRPVYNDSTNPDINGGGIVVFESEAARFVPNDTNERSDIFARNRKAGLTKRLSTTSANTELKAPSISPAISANGRYVSFRSAGAFVPNDTNGLEDVFVRDRSTGLVERVSVSSTGTQGNGASGYAGQAPLSADGRYVVFVSEARNLVPNDTNGVYDVFVHDRQLKTTERASVNSAGVEGNFGGLFPSISGDGRYVSFASRSSNLDPSSAASIAPATAQIFVHDRTTRRTWRISTAANGAAGDEDSLLSAVSQDGQSIAFASSATNLVTGDTNRSDDVFVYSMADDALAWVSMTSAGGLANDGSYEPDISADGRLVVFSSGASNIVPGDTNQTTDVYLRDRALGTTRRVSLSTDGLQGNGESYLGNISGDGRHVVFRSTATNLVASDTVRNWEIFLRRIDP